jgi:hypothetical protein
MFIIALIGLLIFLAWYTTPQVEMTEPEKAEQDRKNFIAELQRRHGERVNSRNKYNG